MDLCNLPPELVDMIKSYLTYPTIPTCKIIQNEIDEYETDHKWIYTRIAKRYNVKNIMSFSDYYFDRANEPWDYNSYIKNNTN